jgi:hypothetical protein
VARPTRNLGHWGLEDREREGEWSGEERGVEKEARRGCTWNEDEARLLAQDGGFFLEEVGQRVEAR